MMLIDQLGVLFCNARQDGERGKIARVDLFKTEFEC